MQIIAHRGASGLAPENTLKAIRLALALGAGAIEIDVQLADGELWVFHDRRLERCTDGSGVLTAQSRAYLASLDAGEGEGIPTLWQVMKAIAGQAELHIELKGSQTADEVARLTRRAEAELGFAPTQWVVSSFHHPELARFATLRPDIRLGALTSTIPSPSPSLPPSWGPGRSTATWILSIRFWCRMPTTAGSRCWSIRSMNPPIRRCWPPSASMASLPTSRTASCRRPKRTHCARGVR